ncbi:MAG TPA: hypothetical protein VK211_28040 [Kamptonema sp.]|nr:hypothetical protein [Kamptonema sp.]
MKAFVTGGSDFVGRCRIKMLCDRSRSSTNVRSLKSRLLEM